MRFEEVYDAYSGLILAHVRSLSRITAAFVVTFAILMPWSMRGPSACPTAGVRWPCPTSCESTLGVSVPCGTGGLGLAFAAALIVAAVLWHVGSQPITINGDSGR